MNWPKNVHQKTFFIVLGLDVVLIPSATVLAVYDVKSWWIAAPLLLLNLPALPLVILFSMIGDSPESPGLMNAVIVIGMFASEIVVSSWAWGRYVDYKLRQRTAKLEAKND